jgi:hypothetical protein
MSRIKKININTIELEDVELEFIIDLIEDSICKIERTISIKQAIDVKINQKFFYNRNIQKKIHKKLINTKK